MIVGSLDRPETYASLLTNDAWRLVFEWASAARTRAPEDGEYPLRGREVRAIVQTVQAKERSEGVFEAHRREVDVHVCLDGSELIEVAPVSSLRPRVEYDAEKDYTLYDVPDSTERVEMTPGAFAVFFPEDGHMPGLKHQHPQMRKIVFKIRRDLV
ncbi:MAG: YhcH/YjgK/YiaL family protein [bacterium]|nr:YhcH/YjgK/YiaL family protein [bacterium]